MLKVLQESICSLSTQFNTIYGSSKSYSKTIYGIHGDNKRCDSPNVFIHRVREPKPIKMLNNYSESSNNSLLLNEVGNQRSSRHKVESIVKDFKLDSSASQMLPLCDTLWRGDAVVNSIDMDHKSLIKTSHRMEIKRAKRFTGSESRHSKTSEDKGVQAGDLKIKDFSDFKELLKDLRLSLHLSDISFVNEQLDNGIKQAEALITEYALLDKEMHNMTEINNQSAIYNISPIKRTTTVNNVKKSQSLNLGHQSKGLYMYNLELLKKSSNLQQIELKFRELQVQPQNIEQFISRLTKEISNRRQKFEELKEFII